MSLVFQEGTHSYIWNGAEIPSVTRVLDHAGLVSYDMVREELLERKSIFGSYVHKACHYYDEDSLDFGSLTDEIKARVDAWASFRSDTGFVPRRIEERFVATVNSMNYGLTADREGFFRSQEAVIDIKTSADLDDWIGIQTAGYALGIPDFEGKLISPMTLFYRRRRMAVQLLPTGKYKKRDFEDRQDAAVFISALHVTHWKMGHGKALRKIEG